MQWGQFLDHDISSTPMIREPDGSLPDCSSCDSGKTNPNSCNPISIPKDDLFFPPVDPDSGQKKCMDFVKSRSTTFLGWKDQFNGISAWIDSSNVYGTFKCQADHLRLKAGGRMNFLAHPLSPHIFKPLLPRHATNHECVSSSSLCFNAGDDRSNEQPGLTSMHTLMLREHNRLADQLGIANPHWDDETVFQEARKIIIAFNQHITYRFLHYFNPFVSFALIAFLSNDYLANFCRVSWAKA
jgi:peroxidase